MLKRICWKGKRIFFGFTGMIVDTLCIFGKCKRLFLECKNFIRFVLILLYLITESKKHIPFC
jgi:hypothetical protein